MLIIALLLSFSKGEQNEIGNYAKISSVRQPYLSQFYQALGSYSLEKFFPRRFFLDPIKHFLKIILFEFLLRL